MVPKTGASLSCASLSFVLLSRRSQIATRDAVRSCRKMESWLQKNVFIVRRKGACLVQQVDPHVIKKTADGTDCVMSIDRPRDVGKQSVMSEKIYRVTCGRCNKVDGPNT